MAKGASGSRFARNGFLADIVPYERAKLSAVKVDVAPLNLACLTSRDSGRATDRAPLRLLTNVKELALSIVI